MLIDSVKVLIAVLKSRAEMVVKLIEMFDVAAMVNKLISSEVLQTRNLGVSLIAYLNLFPDSE